VSRGDRRFPFSGRLTISAQSVNGACHTWRATAPAVLFRCRPDREINTEEPLRYEAMTGLSAEQLTELVARVHAVRGGGFASVGRAYALGLFGSVALVVCLMRKNVTQEFTGAIFGVSQATVSRRWDLLRPLIAQVLAEFVPAPGEVAGTGTELMDGTICPT
jgi:DDE superfamily endonuclease